MIYKLLNLFIKIRKIYYINLNMIASPILLLILLSTMIFPLPGFILDIFFTFNIVLSVIILLGTMFIKNTLDFISFPTAILFSTLLRLSLNIGSTRTILLQGHTGEYAAGSVVKSFGHFLVGNNFTVGITVFIILIVINFIVITKGAGRIAEVGARFALDGMPSKQMAIDADFNAGIINEKEAKQRRIAVYQESEFYGAMDGASKFVRGDAIAGILVMLINIMGGLVVGIVQHNMHFIKATETYTLLTIGDGLVAQIPSLLISIAAGIMVTRINTDENVVEQMINQIFRNSTIMFFASCLLGVMGMIPGMPKIVFFLFSGILFALGLIVYNQQQDNVIAFSKKDNLYIKNNDHLTDVSWKDVKLEDSIRIELGEQLMLLVNKYKIDNLLFKIGEVRKKFAKEVGFLPPRVHICNNFKLTPLTYCILIKGVEIERWDVKENSCLAINVNNKSSNLFKDKVIEPSFGLESYWIDYSLKNKAQEMGFLVTDIFSIIVTHFNKIIYNNISELFSYFETQKLLEKINIDMPKFVDELIPNLINLITLNKILKNLLCENVFIKDMRTILETLLEHSAINKNTDYLTEKVRIALGKFITHNLFHNYSEINIISLDPVLEKILLQSIQHDQEIIEPGLLDKLIIKTKKAIDNQKMLNNPIVLVVQKKLRSFLSKILRVYFKDLFVLSSEEIISNKNIFITSIIGK